MRVAVYSESSADESAVRILVDAVLGLATEHVALPPLRSRGWPSVLNTLPMVIRHLHFHTDAEGLVLVADANGTHVSREDDSNRLLQLRRAVDSTCSSLASRPHGRPLWVAVGVASPMIEAWLLSVNSTVYSEPAWERGMDQPPAAYKKGQLKERLYGTIQPTLEMETLRMTAAARRLCADLDALERLFPRGFGALRSELSRWRTA